MAEELTRKEQFLLKDFDTATQLTYHIDQLRDKVTSFFLTFAGIAVAGVSILLKGEGKASPLGEPWHFVVALLFLVAIIGKCVVCLLAKLRSVQLEHFRIINNIRAYFLAHEVPFWNIVELSAKTLPWPTMRSGTYYWVVIIMVASSGLLTMAVDLVHFNTGLLVRLAPHPRQLPDQIKNICLCFVFMASLLLENLLYFRLAQPPKRREITQAQIAERAYQIYLSGGTGSAEDDWFRAERELLS